MAQIQSTAPQTELEGFVCPSVFAKPILIDGICAVPLDQTGKQYKVKQVQRMRNGKPDDTGTDVHVSLGNGSHFDI